MTDPWLSIMTGNVIDSVSNIQPSDSPYNFPFWGVPKKKRCQRQNEIKKLFFISLLHDFQKLNEEPQQNVDSLPNIDTILHQLGNARYFFAFDLTSKFHHMPMNPKYSRKTAFSAPHKHYEYRQMPN